MIDLKEYYAKVANKESLSADEVVALFKELKHFRGVAAYLASCQAATLESLPKSASKSNRSRHQAICEIAAQALQGNISVIKYPVDIETAIKHCDSAVSK